MTRTIRVIAAIVIAYLVTAFIAWEFDPSKWADVDRIACVSITAVVALYAWLSEKMF